MPDMASITIKKSNGTTDIVYVKKSPSAGDKVAATWTADSESDIHVHRPAFSMTTRSNGNVVKPARKVYTMFRMPIVELIDGVPTIMAYVPISTEATLPTNVSAAKVKEAIYQNGNLMVHALVRSSFEEGYAPT